MYYNTLTRKLDAEDIVKFISRAIEQHLIKSKLLAKEYEKESKFENGRF